MPSIIFPDLCDRPTHHRGPPCRRLPIDPSDVGRQHHAVVLSRGFGETTPSRTSRSTVRGRDRAGRRTRRRRATRPRVARVRCRGTRTSAPRTPAHRPETSASHRLLRTVLTRRRIGALIFAAIPVASSDCADYTVRNLIGINPARKAITIAEAVPEGRKVLFCRCDRESAVKDMHRSTADLKHRIGNGALRGGLYVSCAARGPNRLAALAREPETSCSTCCNRFFSFANVTSYMLLKPSICFSLSPAAQIRNCVFSSCRRLLNLEYLFMSWRNSPVLHSIHRGSVLSIKKKISISLISSFGNLIKKLRKHDTEIRFSRKNTQKLDEHKPFHPFTIEEFYYWRRCLKRQPRNPVSLMIKILGDKRIVVEFPAEIGNIP